MMFSCKVKTLYLLLSSLVLFKLNNGLSLSRSKRSPLEIAVLSPSEFDIRLPEGTLLNFRVNINKELNSDGVADFEKNKTDGPILHFSRDGLNLKGGDNIYYHGTFENDGTYQGEDGVYIFDGVFKASKKTKREVIEGNQDDSNIKTNESRSGSHRSRRHGPPYGYFPLPGRYHHHDPPPFHRPPFGPPYGHAHGHTHCHPHDHSHDHPGYGKLPFFYPGYQPHHLWGWGGKYKPFCCPGSWNGRGNGHRKRPWWQHNEPGGMDNRRPWGDDDDDNNVNPNGGNKENGGNRGTDIESVTKSIVTPPKPTTKETTTTTTAVPKIDIRFPDPE